ncbi:uncharacterized protein LOC126909845 [Daktulosphaira vitifoliae]|uniref:uncharacterized protein LOC126909845 n=1 Tax=Daktulosphaira vitifoliae TaxID=58002 RepID=UPI0021AADBF8|nr:uncharacterized protein LOC126909845 [Daktulosphaira vitifoliae]
MTSVDDIISKLLFNSRFVCTSRKIRALCTATKLTFMKQPMLLRLQAPINVVGDIHGQFSDLLRVFELAGFPPDTNFLFLGDFVDRGPQSLQVITLLFALKTRYPENVYLLRGNHESLSVNHRYGFYGECKLRYGNHRGHRIWKAFNRAFDCLPIAAVIDNNIFCIHGGLSPRLRRIDQIDKIKRPTRVPKSGIMCDFLWADPCPDIQGWRKNEHRNVSYEFGPDCVIDFLNKFGFRLVVRAHQVKYNIIISIH